MFVSGFSLQLCPTPTLSLRKAWYSGYSCSCKNYFEPWYVLLGSEGNIIQKLIFTCISLNFVSTLVWSLLWQRTNAEKVTDLFYCTVSGVLITFVNVKWTSTEWCISVLSQLCFEWSILFQFLLFKWLQYCTLVRLCKFKCVMLTIVWTYNNYFV